MTGLKKTGLLCLLASAATLSVAANERPNVVILYADDMGYGDLGANNPDSKIPTPNLDKLAQEGMRFTDGHSSSGICSPSRYALLTGQHHWRKHYGIAQAFEGSFFEPDEFTLPKMMRGGGYNTAAIGKWHLGMGWNQIRVPGVKSITMECGGKKRKVSSEKCFDWSKPIPDGPLAQGFDYYFGDGTINFPPYCFIENDRVLTPPTTTLVDGAVFGPEPEGHWGFRPGPMATDWNPYKVLPVLTAKAEEWIGRQTQDTPFFLYFALGAPHEPVVPNKEFIGTSGAGQFGDFMVETDAMCGRVLKALDDNGFGENTLVVFTSDNGAEVIAYDRRSTFGHWSSGPLRGLKRDVFEGGHRVPWIVRWPGRTPPGTVCDEAVNQTDLTATLAALIGYELKPTEAIDSYDLNGLFNGEKYQAPLRKAMIHNTRKGRYGIRQGDWVYINDKSGTHSYYKGANTKKEKTPGILYNLQEDIGQLNNVYSQYPEKVAAMKAELDRYVAGEPTAPHARGN